jgi:endonuclease YncB( thermonuclease family)
MCRCLVKPRGEAGFFRQLINEEVLSKLLALVVLGFTLIGQITAASADAANAAEIYVVEGYTIEVHGKRIRLVGFDAPELGEHAPVGVREVPVSPAAVVVPTRA